jgi:oligopeptide transport system ATP-binding protein
MSVAEATGPGTTPLLEVKGLRMHFPVTEGVLIGHKVGEVKAVDGIDFVIRRGETLGLVGESGCGKTTTGRCILRLERPTAGEIRYDGVDIATFGGRRLLAFRRRIQVIFQDPYSSLNPRMKVGEIIAEPIRVHGIERDAARRDARVRELLSVCGLDPAFADRYPHEMSGGQRQRVGIARALALEPEFIVCDEAVSALDVSIQAQIINLLEDLREQFHLTYLFIAHDLSVVRHLCQRVAVMYLGRVVELADCDELFDNPLHPYTQALLSAVPVPDPEVEGRRAFRPLPGEVPSPINPPSGCVFHPRCPIAVSECQRTRPELRELRRGHWVACSQVEPPPERKVIAENSAIRQSSKTTPAPT